MKVMLLRGLAFSVEVTLWHFMCRESGLRGNLMGLAILGVVEVTMVTRISP